MVQNKDLIWARNFLIFTLASSLFYITLIYLFRDNAFSQIFFILTDLTIIYWITYHGIKQRNIKSVLSDVSIFSNLQTKSEVSSIPLDELKTLMRHIDQYMKDSQSFINTDLTIIDVAEKLKEHPKRISTAINSVTNQNFNTYINQYRINKAIALLQNNIDSHLSIDGIGKEVGFNSKSAFYSAFKKETGMPPAKYKEKLAA